MRRAVIAALACAALVTGCGLGGSEDGDLNGDGRSARGDRVVQTTTTRVEVVEGLGEKGSFDPKTIYEREGAGVVTVISLFRGGLASLLSGGNRGDTGLGSGFVISDRGEIVTNAHVITTGEGTDRRRAREVYVEFADGNRVEADIVGDDPNADIALLRVDGGGLELRPLPFGSSRAVQVGEPVAALGSPFGEEQSLSVGVVSAVDRNVESLTDFDISGAVQTDAAINPGNSGGPLLNARGEVIGVNQQIKTASGGGEGVGFAVPVDLVKRSVEQLREEGKVDYAYLGVASQRVYPQLARRFDLPVERGAWLQDVTPDGPAARAGLRGGGEKETVFQAAPWRTGGDIIVRVGSTPIEDSGDLAEAVARYRSGQEVPVEFYRDGEKRRVTVRLGERPERVAPRRGG